MGHTYHDIPKLTERRFSIVLYIVKATELKIDSSLSEVRIPELDKRQSKLQRKSDEVIFENGMNNTWKME